MAISGIQSFFQPAAPAPRPASGAGDGAAGGGGPQDKVQTAPAEGQPNENQTLLGGLANSFKLNLNEEQLADIQAAAPDLVKLAGKDGKWGPSDLADNMQAVHGGKFNILSRTVEKGLRKGFEEMTGKPVPELTAEDRAAAKERWDKLSPEEKKAARLDPLDIKGVGAALKTVQGSTPLTKLGGKSDSIPGNFLQKIAENPTVGGLLDAKNGGDEEKTPAGADAGAPEAAAPAPADSGGGAEAAAPPPPPAPAGP